MVASIEALKAKLAKAYNETAQTEETEPMFVKPHFIKKLGCEGLTSQEVADSLGMRKDNLHVLIKKLEQSGNLTEFQEDTVSIDGVHKSTIYLLPTDEAKFVVTQSATKLGMAYCRFLIACEKALNNLANTKVEERLDKLEETLKALNVKGSNSLIPDFLRERQKEHGEFITYLFNRSPLSNFFIARGKAEEATGTDQFTQGHILKECEQYGLLRIISPCIPGKKCTTYGFTGIGQQVVKELKS